MADGVGRVARTRAEGEGKGSGDRDGARDTGSEAVSFCDIGVSSALLLPGGPKHGS